MLIIWTGCDDFKNEGGVEIHVEIHSIWNFGHSMWNSRAQMYTILANNLFNFNGLEFTRAV
ncbi:protein of unknown function [Ralstonia solanacearum CFBP2957]|nr:protein of unknown function [Ralstonia solanacearum CFBP2957]